jgi:MerR family transcriptional regulator/heat shock protein HspR
MRFELGTIKVNGRAAEPRPTPDPPAPAEADLDAALADRQAPRFSIGQASELLGVTPWFLRRLDNLDVVKPSRSGGAQRRYSRQQLGEVADARAMMDNGVSTAAVRRVLELENRIRELEGRVQQLEAELSACQTGSARGPGH